jgi:hypothetical protein
MRNERRTLALTGMKQVPAARDFASIARSLLSNAQSDGGVELILVDHRGDWNSG